MNIFDVFFIEGETVLFLLISRFIAYKEDHLMNLEEPELLTYLMKQLPFDCFKEISTAELFDLNK